MGDRQRNQGAHLPGNRPHGVGWNLRQQVPCDMVPTRKIAGTAVQALWTATEKRARTATFQTSAHPIVGRSARSAKRGPTTLPVTIPAPKTQITKGTACSGMPATWMRVGVM